MNIERFACLRFARTPHPSHDLWPALYRIFVYFTSYTIDKLHGTYVPFRVITGKSKLSDRVAFWTRQSSIKNKVQETGSDVKEEPIFRRQGSVRDLARQFGSNRNSIELNQKSQNSNSNNSSFQRNSFIRKSWCVSSKGNL